MDGWLAPFLFVVFFFLFHTLRTSSLTHSLTHSLIHLLSFSLLIYFHLLTCIHHPIDDLVLFYTLINTISSLSQRSDFDCDPSLLHRHKHPLHVYTSTSAGPSFLSCESFIPPRSTLLYSTLHCHSHYHHSSDK